MLLELVLLVTLYTLPSFISPTIETFILGRVISVSKCPAQR